MITIPMTDFTTAQTFRDKVSILDFFSGHSLMTHLIYTFELIIVHIIITFWQLNRSFIRFLQLLLVMSRCCQNYTAQSQSGTNERISVSIIWFIKLVEYRRNRFIDNRFNKIVYCRSQVEFLTVHLLKILISSGLNQHQSLPEALKWNFNQKAKQMILGRYSLIIVHQVCARYSRILNYAHEGPVKMFQVFEKLTTGQKDGHLFIVYSELN